MPKKLIRKSVRWFALKNSITYEGIFININIGGILREAVNLLTFLNRTNITGSLLRT